MNRNIFIFAVILVILIGLAYFAFSNVQSFTGGKTLVLKGKRIQLEIADTTKEQEKGLSGRERLAENSGMLFVFEKPGNYSFWMKDVSFPIDIIFLNDKKVVTIHENAKPMTDEDPTNLTLYTPKTPSNRVLELNAGSAKKLGIKEGDTIELPN